MPAFNSSAPGKIILFGEHTVVYGHPAIAAPVNQVRAKVNISANPKGKSGDVRIIAPAIDLDSSLDELDNLHPLAAAIQGVCQSLKIDHIPACTVKVTSTIPVAAGLGSGAAVSVAMIRAISAYIGHPLPDDQVCELAFEVEKLHHGTPSGIDNSVITYAQPIYFVKDQQIELLSVRRPFTIVIADTGIASPTKKTVADVRTAWKKEKKLYEAYFESTASIADSARQAIEAGNIELLGPLMDTNHGLLRKIGVSCPELDSLVLTARRAGAYGAKLSGGGRGGNMIAIVNTERADKVADALKSAGAVGTIVTKIGK